MCEQPTLNKECDLSRHTGDWVEGNADVTKGTPASGLDIAEKLDLACWWLSLFLALKDLKANISGVRDVINSLIPHPPCES